MTHTTTDTLADLRDAQDAQYSNDGRSRGFPLDMPAAGALPPVTVGDAAPLTAAYCAERAARCIDAAERADLHVDRAAMLACAEKWRHLGETMASLLGMVRQRPRDEGSR